MEEGLFQECKNSVRIGSVSSLPCSKLSQGSHLTSSLPLSHPLRLLAVILVSLLFTIGRLLPRDPLLSLPGKLFSKVSASPLSSLKCHLLTKAYSDHLLKMAALSHTNQDGYHQKQILKNHHQQKNRKCFYAKSLQNKLAKHLNRCWKSI